MAACILEEGTSTCKRQDADPDNYGSGVAELVWCSCMSEYFGLWGQ